MANIVILGAGMMGSAFSTPLADNGHRVRLVGTHLDGDIVEEIHESHVHPKLRAHLHPTVVPFTYDRLGEAIQDADVVVIGVNSNGIGWAGDQLAAVLPDDVPLLFLTKGMTGSEDRIDLLPWALREHLPVRHRDRIKLAAIGGPSIAGELVVRHHTCVVVTGEDSALLEQLAVLLRTPYYHVWTSTDMIGVETCVAMKNIYALAVGLANGILEKAGKPKNDAVMWNLAAALFAQGLWETAYVVDYMGGDRRSVVSLPGAGDMYVTSMGGRNGRMGRYLGMGIPFSAAKATYMPDDTIEGAQLLQAIGPTVDRFVADGRFDGAAIPLLRTLIDIVCHDAPPEIPWDDFFAGAQGR